VVQAQALPKKVKVSGFPQANFHHTKLVPKGSQAANYANRQLQFPKVNLLFDYLLNKTIK
jgi:hypothetical protein